MEMRGKKHHKKLTRVDTKASAQAFTFSEWVDKSSSTTIQYIKSFDLTRLNIDELVEMAPSV